MMRTVVPFFTPISSWIFILSALLFSVNQFLIFSGVKHWFLTGYLDDLVLLPVILPLITVLLRLLADSPKLELDVGMVITAFILFSVVFEFVLPHFNKQYTADYFDVLCYGIGGWIYITFRDC